jgi:YbbR domain-containing protein
MAIIKLSASERRRVTVFTTCLALAAVAWLLTGLGSNYSYQATGVLTYKNSPQKRAFRPLQSDTVNITLQGTGWQMLFSRLGSHIRNVPVDLHTLDHQNYLVLSSQLPAINNPKYGVQKILAVSPDTLYYDFTKRLIKKVPVQLISAISYEHQYAPYNATVIKPAYVTVSGPGNLINNIKFWQTDSLKLSDVDETVSTKVRLQAVKEGNLTIYPKIVQVQIPVDEFTEKTLEIPVKLVNNPRFYNVKLFPQKVKVTFTTALSRYKETDEDFFEATADFQLWTDHKNSVLPVKLTRIPAYCHIVRTEPRTIDFIIAK